VVLCASTRAEPSLCNVDALTRCKHQCQRLWRMAHSGAASSMQPLVLGCHGCHSTRCSANADCCTMHTIGSGIPHFAIRCNTWYALHCMPLSKRAIERVCAYYYYYYYYRCRCAYWLQVLTTRTESSRVDEALASLETHCVRHKLVVASNSELQSACTTWSMSSALLSVYT
jgi:hypothetical protein